jgi:hypothetical protein
LAKADFDIQMATQEEEVKLPNKDGEGEHGYYTLNMRKFVHEMRNEDLKKLVATKLGTE